MEWIKNILILIAVVSISVWTGLIFGPEQPVTAVLSMVILGLFIFHLAIRNSLYFQSYFTSPLNVFSSKVRSKKSYDIDQQLMYEKVKEVVEDSAFRLKGTNDNTFEILATTRMTFKSWGENMYIRFEPNGEGTIMKVCSVTFFQMVSWGKNQKNCDDLLHAIERSLTI